MNTINIQSGISIAPSLYPALEAEQYQQQPRSNKKRLLRISAIAFVIAVVVSVIAKGLMYLIDFVTNVSFFGSPTFDYASPAGNSLGVFVVVVPVIGGLIVGVMALYGSKAIRGHGIPEALEQILTNQSKIKPAVTYLKPLASAITIGTGGPFGAEGPIIATGGALGSTIGQILRITHNERKILLAAGATAGMAAIFGTPIAAVLLAIEMLLFEFSPRSLLPVAIACVVGAAGHHVLFGQQPVFAMGDIAAASNTALVVYGGLGIVIGTLSVFVSKAVYYVEELFSKLPVHWMWWPAIGGAVVGVVGYFAPRTLGVGYENITDVLSGSLTVQMIAVLCVMKFVSWVIALGSGTSGGTLAPLLTIGSTAGALIGMGILIVFPSAGITIQLAALVGMAAMFAGASRALLTSIIFAFETTAQTNALIPLVVTCVAAYLVSFFLMEHTIMTEKIARRGVKAPDSYQADLLEQVTVAQMLKGDGTVLKSENTIAEVLNLLSTEPDNYSNYFIVTNNDGSYQGIISSSNLFAAHHNPEKSVASLIKRRPVFVYANNSLRSAVEIMANENVDVLPVVSGDNMVVVGVLSYRDILATYKHEVNEHEIHQPNIIVKRRSLQMLVRWRRMVGRVQHKSDNSKT